MSRRQSLTHHDRPSTPLLLLLPTPTPHAARLRPPPPPAAMNRATAPPTSSPVRAACCARRRRPRRNTTTHHPPIWPAMCTSLLCGGGAGLRRVGDGRIPCSRQLTPFPPHFHPRRARAPGAQGYQQPGWPGVWWGSKKVAGTSAAPCRAVSLAGGPPSMPVPLAPSHSLRFSPLLSSRLVPDEQQPDVVHRPLWLL